MVMNFLSATKEISLSKNKVRLMNSNNNKRLGAGRVVHLIEGTTFSCPQVYDIVPF